MSYNIIAVDSFEKELDFFFGFAGEFTMSSVDYESGTAFVSYDNEKLAELIYFNSKATGKPYPTNLDLSIKTVANALWLGNSKIDDLIKLIGTPLYNGRRVNFSANINHTVAYWDASQLQPNGAIKEKWLLVGYDQKRVIQDFIWVTSKPEDIKDFGNVTEQQIERMSRVQISGFVPISVTTSMNVGAKIDPIQVDALIRSQPKNIKEIIDVIGQPSAIGMKNFMENGIVTLSNWSFSTVEMKGKEDNYVPLNATPEIRAKLGEKPSFMVMKVDQSRLVVAHSANGEIKEILWTKAIK